jgi:hypothetical protein
MKLPEHLIGTCYYIKGCAGIKGFVVEEIKELRKIKRNKRYTERCNSHNFQ